jgi:hypothetical protein
MLPFVPMKPFMPFSIAKGEREAKAAMLLSSRG